MSAREPRRPGPRRRLRRRRRCARAVARPATRSRLLEARDRLGGRTWFRRAALAGHDLEMGGTWIVPEQRHVWAEVARYGLDDAVLGLSGLVRLADGRRAASRRVPGPRGGAARARAAACSRCARRPRGSTSRGRWPSRTSPISTRRRPTCGSSSSGSGRTRATSRLACFSGAASAMPYECSILEVVRWLAAADGSIWRWLAASVLGHVLERRQLVARRRDRTTTPTPTCGSTHPSLAVVAGRPAA